MTDPIIDRLDQIKGRADKATEGPWVWCRTNHGFVEMTAREFGPGSADDAEFITAARTDVPQMEQALRAVLEPHRRATDFYEPDDFCPKCSSSRWTVQWPCPPYKAIADALGVEIEEGEK